MRLSILLAATLICAAPAMAARMGEPFLKKIELAVQRVGAVAGVPQERLPLQPPLRTVAVCGSTIGPRATIEDDGVVAADEARAERQHPRELSEDEAPQLHSEVLDPVVALGLAVAPATLDAFTSLMEKELGGTWKLTLHVEVVLLAIVAAGGQQLSALAEPHGPHRPGMTGERRGNRDPAAVDRPHDATGLPAVLRLLAARNLHSRLRQHALRGSLLGCERRRAAAEGALARDLDEWARNVTRDWSSIRFGEVPVHARDALAAMIIRYGWPSNLYWAGFYEDGGHFDWLGFRDDAINVAPEYKLQPADVGKTVRLDGQALTDQADSPFIGAVPLPASDVPTR